MDGHRLTEGSVTFHRLPEGRPIRSPQDGERNRGRLSLICCPSAVTVTLPATGPRCPDRYLAGLGNRFVPGGPAQERREVEAARLRGRALAQCHLRGAVI